MSNQQVIDILNQGGVIAYPTEAVFGLGCDPFNEQAVTRLLALKKRDPAQGLILLIPNWQWFHQLSLPLPKPVIEKIKASWPGPKTWLVPAAPCIPTWIKGQHQSVALRISDHPPARELVEAYDHPLVSTSANRHHQPALCDEASVKLELGDELDYLVGGQTGALAKPTTICDALSDTTIR